MNYCLIRSADAEIIFAANNLSKNPGDGSDSPIFLSLKSFLECLSSAGEPMSLTNIGEGF